MSRVVVYLYYQENDTFINLQADELVVHDEVFIEAKNQGKTVGVFAFNDVKAAYISKKDN